MRWCRTVCASFAASFLTACGSSAPSTALDSASALSSRGGGCHLPAMGSGPLALLSLVNPEWAPVLQGASPLSRPVLAHGTAIDSHVSLADFPSTHRDFDQNTGLRLDASDADLLAPGNALESGEPLLGLEWEVGAYPEWAWAGEGDRVVVLGRWIFDCGHPAPLPAGTCAGSTQSCAFDSDCGGGACVGAGGTCRGAPDRCWVDADCGAGGVCDGVQVRYWTELHPPQGVAVIRTGGGDVLAGATAPVTRADVFVSADGGGAGDTCVVTHRASLAEQLAASCFPLSDPLALNPDDRPPLATDLRFDVPLPPGGGGAPVWNVAVRPMPGGGAVAATARLDVVPVPGGDAPHLSVTVRMSEPVDGQMPSGFAGTLIAGWDQPPPSDLAHVRVSIDGVVVQDSRKDAATDPLLAAPAGWRLHASVNGAWQQLPGLDAVDASSSGQTLPATISFDQYVARSGAVRLHAEGGSFACANKLMGRALADDLALFGGNLEQASRCLLDSPHDLGAADATWAGPDFGASSNAGMHVVASTGGAYALTVHVEVLPP